MVQTEMCFRGCLLSMRNTRTTLYEGKFCAVPVHGRHRALFSSLRPALCCVGSRIGRDRSVDLRDQFKGAQYVCCRSFRYAQGGEMRYEAGFGRVSRFSEGDVTVRHLFLVCWIDVEGRRWAEGAAGEGGRKEGRGCGTTDKTHGAFLKRHTILCTK